MSKATSLTLPWPVVAGPYPVTASLRPLLWLWVQRARQRRRLAELDTAQLRDIGVEPEAARQEAAKPFWRA